MYIYIYIFFFLKSLKYVLKRFSGKRADVEKIRNKKTILVFVDNVERIKKKSHIHTYIATYKRIYMYF